MRKILYVLAASALMSAAFTGCREKLKDVTGLVTTVDLSRMGDTIHYIKMATGEDTLIFTVKDAEYTNGFMIPGDSAQVYYFKGNGDTLRAMVIGVKPKPAHVIDIKKDTTETLLTR